MLASLLLPVIFLFQAPSLSVTPTPAPQQQRPEAQQARSTPSPEKEEPPVVTHHSVRVGGKQLNYSVATGFMPLKNNATGETEAHIFYIAYTLDNSPAGRPLMFSFNGGPGSASVWLHLGALGPRRIKMLDDGMMPPP